jgi:peptidoglycan hydrolase FlgJ
MSDDLKLSMGALGGAGLSDLRLQQTRLERTLGDTAKVKAPGQKSSDQEIERAATDFESLLLQQMLQSMWSTVPQNGMLTGSREETLYRDMLNEQLAQSMAENQSLGIKELIARDMRKSEK